VMRGMMDDVVPRLRTGAVVIARTVKVEGAGEGVIADPLRALAGAHPDLSIGSYPFYGPEGYGSNLVVRGRVAEEVEQTVDELIVALADIGARAITKLDA